MDRLRYYMKKVEEDDLMKKGSKLPLTCVSTASLIVEEDDLMKKGSKLPNAPALLMCCDG